MSKRKLKLPKNFKYPVEPEVIDCKSAAYALFQKGEFGNAPRRWSSLEDLYASDYRGLVTVRYANPDRSYTAAHIPFAEVPARVAEWVSKGADARLFRPNESLPDEVLAIQGEFFTTFGGHNLRYSTAKGLSMRQAMTNPQYAEGYRALALMAHFMDANSMEDFRELLERFPDSVFEFATYERPVGVLPRRNTIIFEIRNF